MGAMRCDRMLMNFDVKGKETHSSLSVVKLQWMNNTNTIRGNRRNAMTFDCKSVGRTLLN